MPTCICASKSFLKGSVHEKPIEPISLCPAAQDPADIFTVAADRILLVLGGLIFAASLVLGSSLWGTAARGQYEVVEGICASVSTPMLRRYRKIQLIDEQGAERTLLLSKTAKFQIGARYRFYFQKGSRPAVGNDYLDTALSTNSFLGYEVLEGIASCDEEMESKEQTPHE